MKKLQTGFFLSLFAGCLIAINGCKKETAFSSEQLAIEQQLATEKANVFSNIAAKQSGGNITVAGGRTFEELGATTTYTFNAVQQHNGKTNGHLILQFRAADSRMFVKIDCLRLFGDNKATMSGIITLLTQSSDFPPPPFIFVGGRVSFTVQDNGEGSSASPDLVSDIGELIFGTPASCDDEWPVYLAGANVQINK
jgi:hypothetical protein